MDWRPFWEEGDPNPNATPDAPPPSLPTKVHTHLFVFPSTTKPNTVPEYTSQTEN